MAKTRTSRVRLVHGDACAQLDHAFAAGLKEGDALDAVVSGADGLLLGRSGTLSDGYYAGAMSSMSLAEVFDDVLSSIRTGRLVVTSGELRKVVSFRDGQVIFASSTEPHERLGSALVRLSLLDRQELQKYLLQVRQGAKLGQLLTKSGRLSAAQLYSAMTFLVREIVLDLFSLADGDFLFIEGAESTGDMLRLPERTKAIALEGVRRGEETAKLRRRLTPGHLVRRAGTAPPSEHQELWRSVAGTMALADVRKQFDGGEHAFLAAVDDAVKLGALQLVGQVGPQPAKVALEKRSPVERYRAAVQAVCAALLDGGESLDPLRSFFAAPQPGTEEAFAGVTLGPKGELDVDQVTKNLSKAGPVIGRAKTYEALNAFVSFALFSAKNTLSRERARALELLLWALFKRDRGGGA